MRRMGLLSLAALLVAFSVMAGGKHYTYEELKLPQGGSLSYALILPEHFDPKGIYPALLALPPGNQTREMVEAGLKRYWGAAAARRGWIVASPVAPGGKLFFQGSEHLIPPLLDRLQARFHIEGGKFHLAGVSNGGRSAFRVALDSPERFASLTVLPGFPPSREDFGRLELLKGLPVQMFAGGNDHQWVKMERETKEKLDTLGIEASLTVFPGEGHVPSSMEGARVMKLLEKLRPKN
ncbi:MAG: hypothetical protein ACE5ID_04085 [Acidobacteriota bacterium]